jgi:hypothetical protein
VPPLSVSTHAVDHFPMASVAAMLAFWHDGLCPATGCALKRIKQGVRCEFYLSKTIG